MLIWKISKLEDSQPEFRQLLLFQNARGKVYALTVKMHVTDFNMVFMRCPVWQTLMYSIFSEWISYQGVWGSMQVWLCLVEPQLCAVLSDSALKANFTSKFYTAILPSKNS